MTDLEAMLAMLARAGIASKCAVIEEVSQAGSADTVVREPGFVVMTVQRGYSGFMSDLIFDLDGSLKSIEAFE